MNVRVDPSKPAPSAGTAEQMASLHGEGAERCVCRQRFGPWSRVAALIGIAAAITAILRLTPLGQWLTDFHRLRFLLDEGDVWAELVFLPLVALLVAVGTPRLIFYCLAGLTFGFWKGLLLAQIGTLAGAYATYLSVRWAGRGWVSAWLARYPSARKVLTIRPSVWPVLMTRQVPLAGLVINIALGLSPVGSVSFLIGSFLGFLPLGVVVTLVGSGLVEDQAWESAVQLLMAALVALFSAVWLGRKTIQRIGEQAEPDIFLWGAAISCAVLGMYLVRLSGPPDLEGYAQDRNIGYIMDAAWRGNWVVQHDVQNRITSKPPLHTWVTAILARIWGINRLTLTLPSFVSVLALALLVLAVGCRLFGLTAGGFAGLAVAMAPMLSKHVALVRTDPMFALAVTLGALAAWRAWNRGRGWMSFWLAAVVATLVKGPLGLVLAAAGLLAFFWEKHTDPNTPALHGRYLSGGAVYLGIGLGWLVLAVYAAGYEVIDKMIIQELVGQATGATKSSFPGANLPKPTIYLLSRFLPFSIFTFLGLWRAVRHPAAYPMERRFERFLVCWMVTGLAIFSLAAHHRPDLLLPLWPAGALLAGRQIACLKERLGPSLLAGGAVVACLILTGLAYWTYHWVPERRARVVNYSVQVRQAAEALRQVGVEPIELTHIQTPVTLQLYLQTYKPWTTVTEMRGLLDCGEPLLVVTAVPRQEHRREPSRKGPLTGLPGEYLASALSDADIEELYRWPEWDAHEEDFSLALMRVVHPG